MTGRKASRGQVLAVISSKQQQGSPPFGASALRNAKLPVQKLPVDTLLRDERLTSELQTDDPRVVADPLHFSSKSKPSVVCTFPLKPSVDAGNRQPLVLFESLVNLQSFVPLRAFSKINKCFLVRG